MHLEDVTDRRGAQMVALTFAQRKEGVTAQPHRACRRWQQPGQDIEERRLAATADPAQQHVGAGEFRWLAGEDQGETFQLRPTYGVTRCRTCGTPLPAEVDEANIYVTAGTLDEPLGAGVRTHLFCASRADWDPGFLEALASSSTVYCPDNRGIGDSDFGDGTLSIESMAGDMLGLLDSLGLDRVDVAGWSMGGFISQQLASMAPGRVSGLVLMATDPGGDIRIPPEREDWRKLTDHSGTPHEQAKRLLELLFPQSMAAGVYEQFGDLVAAAQEKLDPEVISAQEAAMIAWANGPSKARLEAITAPVLAVAGSEDVVIPPGNAEVIARHLPDSWLARFPGCAHALMAQEPKRLGNLIAAFLDR